MKTVIGTTNNAMIWFTLTENQKKRPQDEIENAPEDLSHMPFSRVKIDYKLLFFLIMNGHC